MGMKGLYEQCSIVRKVVWRGYEVLAGWDKVDVWDSSWGQGSGGKDTGERERVNWLAMGSSRGLYLSGTLLGRIL